MRQGYRLFLGRDPENDEVVAERVGQPRAPMVLGFIGSDEFARLAAVPADGIASLPSALGAPAAPDLAAWAAGFFGPGGWAAGFSRLDLLVDVVRRPPVADLLAQRWGAAQAAGIVAGLGQAAARLREAPAGSGVAVDLRQTTAEDVANLYLLLLDRVPDPSGFAESRFGTPLVDTVVEMLRSREFADGLAAQALAHRLPADLPLPPALRRWAADVLDLALPDDAGQHRAVAAMLAHPAVLACLDRRPPDWPVAAVAAVLRTADANAVPASRPLGPTAFRWLVEASGLFDADWYLARHPDLLRAGAEPLNNLVHGGARAGRDPGPDFETAFYLEQYPELEGAALSALEHYLRFGRQAGATAKGPPAYQRWLARFDDLSAADRTRIADMAAALPAPAVLRVGGAAGDTAEQIGPVPTLVAGAGALADIPDGQVVILQAGGARLRPHACFAFAQALARPDVGAAYSDHDHVDDAGERRDPVFKPAMSPDFLRTTGYAGPVAAVRLDGETRPLLAEAVGHAAGNAPAAVAGLLGALAPERIAHIPFILYSLPRRETGPHRLAEKAYEPVAPSAPDLAPPLPADLPRVDLLIPTRDRLDLLRPCVDSILAATDYPRDRLQITVVDNGSVEEETLTYLDDLAGTSGCNVVRSPGPFNYSSICNAGAAATAGEVIVFLNNDMAVRARDWLLLLVGYAVRPDIGAVGAQLIYPDDTVQHGGIILGLRGIGGHRLASVSVADAGPLDATREMTVVTGACLAIRRRVFEEVGGLDTALAVAFNDVLLCLAVVAAGYRNLYVARPLLYHYESRSRGVDDDRIKLARAAREGIYTRRRHPAAFQDDPSYSPNLSLQEEGALAVPPRVVRPWRRRADGRRVLILSVGHRSGDGIACVVAEQAAAFLRRGWEVMVGGPVADADRAYPGCTRASLRTPEAAAAFAVAEGVDCVIAHTPPFFSVTRFLGRNPPVFIHDHGEPPPALFADRAAREDVNWEKRFCLPLARRMFAVSEAVAAEQFGGRPAVIRNGNGHLATWSPAWGARRTEARRRLGWEGCFVILDVCRFHAVERACKGVDAYLELAAETPYAVPGSAGRVLFVLAGRGDLEDVAHVRASGVTVFPDVSDEELAELYAASDLFVSLSRWEGYNVGIGQALAMGLPVVASDIPAHHEFGVPTAATLGEACRLVGEAFGRAQGSDAPRTARVEPWDGPMTRMIDLIEADLDADHAGADDLVRRAGILRA